jgi:hypothetical protein
VIKKYELTDDIINYNGFTLHRIKALRNFNDIKKGELGGYIEKEDNLSHKGDCWVYNDAKVYDNANVYGNARVYRYAKVFGNAEVCGNARVYRYAKVYGNAEIFGNAEVCGSVLVYGDAWVYGDAKVFGNARVYRNARVFGDAKVYRNARVYGDAKVFGSAEITRNCLNIYNKELYQCNITFTDYHISIGCKQMSFIKWLEVSLDDAIAMGLKEEYYDNIKSLLKLLISQYYNKKLA